MDVTTGDVLMVPEMNEALDWRNRSSDRSANRVFAVASDAVEVVYEVGTCVLVGVGVSVWVRLATG